MNIEEIKKIITRYYRTLNYREDINFNGSLLLFFISYFDNKEEKYKYIKVYTDIKRYTVEIINEKEVSNETTQLRQIIHNDIFAGPSGLPRERSIGRGDLSRFYNNKKNKF